MRHVPAEYEVITLERLKEVQAQAEAAKVKVAEADALDAAVQLMEDFQVCIWHTNPSRAHPPCAGSSRHQQGSKSPIRTYQKSMQMVALSQMCRVPGTGKDCSEVAISKMMAMCRSAARH